MTGDRSKPASSKAVLSAKVGNRYAIFILFQHRHDLAVFKF